MAELELVDVGKSYEHVEVMRNVNLSIRDGEFIVFVGPSGCGKSTLLRMIAGLEPITTGTLKINGQVCNILSPVQRGVAMVFQSYALYPHMSVRKNMSFGLKIAGYSRSETRSRVERAAQSLQIEDYLDRLPKDLSGGQRQRVAIGRSIVREPKVFLFDEPLSNLDAALRVQTRVEIARLHKELRTTMIYVTHDQTEAMTLADRIAVLSNGRIEQVGTPLELYRRPENLFVAGFIGSPRMNLIQTAFEPCGDEVAIHGLQRPIRLPFAGRSDEGTLGIRPEDLIRCRSEEALLSGSLVHEEHMGEYRLLYLDAGDGKDFVAKIPGDAEDIQEGDVLGFAFLEASAHLFDGDGTRLSEAISGEPV